MTKIKSLIDNGVEFLRTKVWEIDSEKKPWVIRVVLDALKTILLAYKGFFDDKVKLRASALTFFSLLSIVPVLAMAFGIAKGFGLDKELEKQLISNFSGQEEILAWSLGFAQTLLENTRGGLVAGIGLLVLIYSVMELFNNIEKSFNDIWYIKQERPMVRKLTDYLTIILIAPVLMIISNSLTVFIANAIQRFTVEVEIVGFFRGIIFPMLKILPYMVIWLLFTLLYIIMPNTKVKLKSALVAGILAGTAFLIFEWAMIRFQLNVSEYNAIYGSFAALPLFLTWMQVSWLIVLFGAEISYSAQNLKQHEHERSKIDYSLHSRKIASLQVIHLLVKNLTAGNGGTSFETLNSELRIPSRFLKIILDDLIAGKIVSEVLSTSLDGEYLPAYDVSVLTPALVISKLEMIGSSIESSESEKLEKVLREFNKLVDKSASNQLLKDL